MNKQAIRLVDWERALHVHGRTVRRMSRDGRLPRPLPTGRLLRWPPDAIDKFMKTTANREAVTA